MMPVDTIINNLILPFSTVTKTENTIEPAMMQMLFAESALYRQVV